jgi:4-hydroxybenzoate polyprenyltransferase
MFRSIFNFVLYSNMLVSICAALMVSVTQIIFGEPNGYYLGAFTFFSTFSVYNFQRIFPFIFGEITDNLSIRQQWILTHLAVLILLASFSLFAASIIYFYLIDQKLFLFILLLPLFFVSIWYAVDLKRLLNSRKSYLKKLRNVPYLKIFLIGFTWSLVTVGLPYLESKTSVQPLELWWLFLERMLFFFAIILPFDIRDIQQDKHYNLRTIPNKIGEKASIRLALILLFAFCCLVLLRIVVLPNTAYLALPLAISAIVTAAIILKAKAENSEYYFSGLVDATMVIQFLLVWLAWVLK